MAFYPCPQGHGDVNQDGIIDERDADLLRGCYLKTTAEHPECALADIDRDGQVRAPDFSIMSSLFNGYDPICQVNLVPVTPPEPSRKFIAIGLGFMIAAGAICVAAIAKGR